MTPPPDRPPQPPPDPPVDIRDYFHATNPGSGLDTQDPKQAPWYIDLAPARGGRVIDDILQEITFFSPDIPTCTLFTGHIGCGKSTELMQLQLELERSGFLVVYFASSEDLEMVDVDVCDVLLAVARRIKQSLGDLEIGEAKGLRRIVQHAIGLMQTEVEISEVGLELGIATITAQTKSDATLRDRLNQYLGPQKALLLEAINDELLKPAIVALKKTGRQGLVVIVDNLDRVDNRPKASGRSQQQDLFIDQSEYLIKLHCHKVYTLPLAMKFSSTYGELTQRYPDEPKVLPMVQLQNRDGSAAPIGLALMQDIVLARALPQLAPEARRQYIPALFGSVENLERLCQLSGGHVRDLLRLLNDWVRKGRRFPLQRDKLEEAIRSRRNEMILQISDREWEQLREVQRRKWVSDSQGYQTLIHTRLVFEYRHGGESWFDVNPILLNDHGALNQQ